MKETIIVVHERPDIYDPVFIEGLPGIGLVGKLAAEHLIQELKAKKFAELYSPHFMHQVLIRKGSIVELMKNEFYYWKSPDDEHRDLIIVTGIPRFLLPIATATSKWPEKCSTLSRNLGRGR